MDRTQIVSIVEAVTKKWTRQRKAEERDESRRARRQDALKRNSSTTIKDIAYEIMPDAYFKASSGGTLPAVARQIMYAARPAIQDRTGRQLDDQYFTQQLLPDYLHDHPEETHAWRVVFDARGHLRECHTGLEVPLGTVAVDDYLSESGQQHHLDRMRLTLPFEFRVPTHGPKDRYQAILFVEKEGFLPLFDHVRLAERFDVALMSTKGMSVTACRQLVEELCSRHEIPLLVLRDFDKAGFSIVGTFRRDTRRYEFTRDFQVIDLGLRLEDVERYHLEREAVNYGRSHPGPNLRKNGATEEEIQFLCSDERSHDGYSGWRVELNAFASQDLVNWIEGKLRDEGIAKVIPEHETLELAYRRATALASSEGRLNEVIKMAEVKAARAPAPDDLEARVHAILQTHPELPWDAAIEQIARDDEHVQ